MILLKSSPQCGSAILDPMLASISPKARGWVKTFFLSILMIGSDLRVYSNSFAAPGEEPSPTYGYFIFGSLNYFLVVGFLGDIFPATKIKF
jgi:hypothetical protein